MIKNSLTPAFEKKRERLEHANTIIKVMSRHGRRFFYNERKNSVAYFLFDKNNRLCFCDDYIQKPFVVTIGKDWKRNFSQVAR